MMGRDILNGKRVMTMLCLERDRAGHQKGQCKLNSCLVQMLGSTQISSGCCQIQVPFTRKSPRTGRFKSTRLTWKYGHDPSPSWNCCIYLTHTSRPPVHHIKNWVRTWAGHFLWDSCTSVISETHKQKNAKQQGYRLLLLSCATANINSRVRSV